MMTLAPASDLSVATLESEIACARRVAAMLIDPRDQAIVRDYISELAVEADKLQDIVFEV